MNKLTKYLLENNKVIEISDKLNSDNLANINIIGLTVSAKASLAYALTLRSKKNSVIICSNGIEAKKMIQDLKFFSEIELVYFPAREFNYYDTEAESKEIENQRMYAIKKILSKEKIILVTTIDALIINMLPVSSYDKGNIIVKKNCDINLKSIVFQLIDFGYEKSEIVEGKGQFSIRGGIIDIFPLNNELPYRIELFGDTVDNIRTFDVISQRSIDTVNEVEISIFKEANVSKGNIENTICKLEELSKKDIINEELKSYLMEDIEKLKLNNIEGLYDKYFELLVSNKVSLLDYLEDYTLFIDEFERCRQKADNLFYENAETLKVLSERNYLYIPYANKYIDFYEIEKKINLKNNIFLESINNINVKTNRVTYNLDTKEAVFYRNGLDVLLQDIKRAKEKLKILVFSTDVRVEQVKNYLIDNKIKAKYLPNLFFENDNKNELNKDIVYITKNILSEGFLSNDLNIFLLSERISGTDILNKKRKTSEKKKIGQVINSFEDLEVNSYVVHENHGIGIYRGIETINAAGVISDYIKLEYANKGVLYIPINQLDNVKKYSCDDDTVPKINTLSSKDWEKTKRKVTEHVKEVAKELIKLYAKREKAMGYKFPKDTPWQKEFEDTFEYELTSDQYDAVKEIKEDMENVKPMDRLLCGDVGYGKTEVAIRAAFKAAVNSKQVAYLVPTTVLSLQQYKNFKERMEPFGIRVEMLSRFKTQSQQKKILEGLINGKIDVVIGTHRLLSKDVFFKDLGLLIIDEEHRFGVKAKETIKILKENVDVLSMTATPIPRTLHMSMIGIRSMSTLTEPPLERLPVHTYVLEYDENVIKNAIEKELLRDGQVIYLNNRVDDIEEIANKVRNLVPGVKLSIAHGKMDVNQIEDTMMQFMNHEIDVLVCTTILESGIDIPNANTLIVENADKLGLAQLYQIRGRVGRSSRLAYAYITYPKNKQITEVSEKRLKAIKDFAEFGSGYKIALRDLEIRGAGNLLGKEQHGHMINVGYEMYVNLLEKAINDEKNINENKKEHTPEISKDVKIMLNVSAYISDEYIKNPVQKIMMYQKISDIKNKNDMLDIIDELLDRYGDIPKETENLIKIVEIRNLARKLNIKSISIKGKCIVFEPGNLKYTLTNINSNDILIRVQMELTKLDKMLKEKG